MTRRQDPLPPVDSPLWKNQTAFRIMERRCKRKGPIDASILTTESTEQVPIKLWEQELEAEFFKGHEGFFLIRNAVPVEMQKELVKEALEHWAKPPNVCNLDLHFKLDPKGIWNQYAEYMKAGPDQEAPIIPKRIFKAEAIASKRNGSSSAAHGSKVEYCELSKAAAHKDTEYMIDDETQLAVDKPVDNMLDQNDAPVTKILLRLRWLTLGHQYDWTKKEYHLDRVPPFPSKLARITTEIVQAIEGITKYPHTKWKPEAGIVNFYQPGDSLTAHQDRSELTADPPLLSISIGLECVFLFGTTSRNDVPIALKLKSGDMVVMHGAGRLAFHGVPLVFPNTLPEELTDIDPLMSQYLSHTRINLNIRQVY